MKPYNGIPRLKQLAHLRENYKGKNMSGGRKCLFTQSKEYNRRYRGRIHYVNRNKSASLYWSSGVVKLASAWCSDLSLSYFVLTSTEEQT